MLIVTENLNFKNRVFMDAVKKRNKGAIVSLAKGLAERGADLIQIQCSADGSGDEDVLPFVAEVVQEASDAPLCLDSRNVEALKRTLPLCSRPCMINYLSADERDPEAILSLVNQFRTHLVLRALKGTVPTTLEAKLLILEDLIEEANAADIPNERLYADPSVVHMGKGMGQDHLLNTHACIQALREMVDPPINTIAWISNVSTGLSKRLKTKINAAFLCYLAGAGLDAAIIDVTDDEIMKTIYLIRSFRDEVIFSPSEQIMTK